MIDKVLYEDIPAVYGVKPARIRFLKILLQMVASSPPFTLEVNRVSAALGISKEYLHNYLDYLEEAGLILCLRARRRGISTGRKPERIFLANPNLLFSLDPGAKPGARTGAARETFFLDQVRTQIGVFHDPKLDFLLADGRRVEIGGKSKDTDAIAGEKNAFLAVDGITIGAGRKIPLYLFGLLY